MGIAVNIDQPSLRATLRALKLASADIEKQVRKSINEAVAQIRTTARGYIPQESPMSGWTPGSWGHRGWSTSEARAGIQRKNDSYKTDQGSWVRSIEIANTSAAGMIFELAGSKSDGHSRAGRQFITNIERHGLRRPLRRALVRAGVEELPRTRKRIEEAVAVAETVIQQRIPVVHRG